MNKEQKINAIRSELLAIRDTGATNMFDSRRVKEISDELGFEELSECITNNSIGYTNTIFTGETELQPIIYQKFLQNIKIIVDISFVYYII